MMQGNVQQFCIMATRARSLTRTEIQVRPSRVKQPMTVAGIVSRFVVNYSRVSRDVDVGGDGRG